MTIPTELEYDVWRASRDRAGVELLIVRAGSGPPAPYYHASAAGDTREDRRELLHRVADMQADLYVFRYPLWVVVDGLVDEAQRLFGERPAVAWMSEQGPALQDALRAAAPWRHVAVTNRLDMDRYRHWMPETRLHRLPFGTCAWESHEVAWQDRLRADVVADGGPHYACLDHGGWKKDSVDVMLAPLIGTDLNLALWGAWGHEHGWDQVPGAKPYYRGEYHPSEVPLVYASARLYVGITWNWAFGGYGMKLARALGTGVPVLWHRTPGMRDDGLIEGVHLMCSSSAAETRAAVRWLVDNEVFARKMGRAGRDFALREWEWMRNLERLAMEVRHR